jgi:hypothetical protein
MAASSGASDGVTGVGDGVSALEQLAEQTASPRIEVAANARVEGLPMA